MFRKEKNRGWVSLGILSINGTEMNAQKKDNRKNVKDLYLLRVFLSVISGGSVTASLAAKLRKMHSDDKNRNSWHIT